MKSLSLMTLVLAMLAIVLLAEKASAQATRAPAISLAPHALAVEEEGEAAEEEGDVEESEVEGEEEGEGEPGKPEAGAPRGVPDECLEYTVAARVVSSLSRHSVRLEVSYDSSESGRASLSFALKGSRGALRLGTMSWRLSAWGHLERTVHLGDRELMKLGGARSFTVRVKMPGTPSYCEIYRTRRLVAQRHRGGQTLWTERAGGTQALRRPNHQR